MLGIMNASGYAFNAWLPILVYPVKDAPRFRKGFVFSCGAFVAQGVVTWGVWWLQRWEGRKKGAEGGEDGRGVVADIAVLPVN